LNWDFKMELLINLINYIPNIFQYIFAFAILITVVVFVHEMGHYLVGKWCGIGVETFSIGMGKQIWGKYDKSGTLWRVALFPVGGYVKFKGDEDLSGKRDKNISTDQSDNFHSKSVWQKVATTAAGPVFNFILAIFIFAMIFIYKGETLVEPLVGEVLENSAASESGIKKGDLITSINGNKINSFNDIRNYIIDNPRNSIEIIILRNGSNVSLSVKPKIIIQKDRFGGEYKVGRIGIMAEQDPSYYQTKNYGIFSGFLRGIQETFSLISKILSYLGQLIMGRESVDQMGGPIKIIQVSGQVAEYGFIPLFGLIAAISVNLGVINLLPIPVLDGGHLLFYTYEIIFGKPINPKVQEYGMQIGVSLLIALMVFVTILDISRL
tara:strand:+ start:2716 stop:3855 length:1140 start_codon:yes stop_codon:yes gene_type:complete